MTITLMFSDSIILVTWEQHQTIQHNYHKFMRKDKIHVVLVLGAEALGQ